MLQKIEKMKILLMSVFFIFHIIAYYKTRGGNIFKEDLRTTCGKSDFVTFMMWLYKKKYIRNLFYYRIGRKFKFFLNGYYQRKEHYMSMTVLLVKDAI